MRASGSCGCFHSWVGSFLLALAVQLHQLLAGAAFRFQTLSQPLEKLVVPFPAIPSNDAAQRGIAASSVVASMPSVFPFSSPRFADALQHPLEDGGMSLDIDQSPRSGKGGSDPAEIHSTSVPETRAAPASQPPATRFLAPNPGLRNSPPAAAESRRPVPDSAAPSAGHRIGAPSLDEIVKLMLLQKIL